MYDSDSEATLRRELPPSAVCRGSAVPRARPRELYRGGSAVSRLRLPGREQSRGGSR
jgi:hypothetical protein